MANIAQFTLGSHAARLDHVSRLLETSAFKDSEVVKKKKVISDLTCDRCRTWLLKAIFVKKKKKKTEPS